MRKKKFNLWLVLISTGFSIFIIASFLAVVWFWSSANEREFEIYALELMVWFLVVDLLLFTGLYFLFQKAIYKLIRLNSENPFNDTFQYNSHGLNPFVFLRKNIASNNERSFTELHKLHTLEQYRREYIGNVSHELKTPIFNIQGYLSSLLEGGMDDQKVKRVFLEKAEKNVDRMIDIVEDLQIISRFEAGELKLEKEVFGVFHLIEEVIDSEKEAAAKHKVLFALFRDKEIEVYADKYRIRQVLTNLLINSIKYSKPGGGQTDIRVYDLGSSVKVQVSDNGIGIDNKHLNRIFERFYRVDSSRSREKGGSGLGLAIVKHIIEAHGESIEVMSTPNVGSVFSFMLTKPESE